MPDPEAGLSATLTRTSYGVVHISANDFEGLGFGLAYAYAQDNVCMLADSLLTARGERSRYFGGDAMPTTGRDGEYSVVIDYLNLHNFNLRNEDSDFFFKAYLDPARLRAGYEAGGAETAALLNGYAAGYNRYLREHAGQLPAACRGAAWVKPITVDDVHLMIAEKALHASGQLFAAEILAAAHDDQRARSAATCQRRHGGPMDWAVTPSRSAPMPAWMAGEYCWPIHTIHGSTQTVSTRCT